LEGQIKVTFPYHNSLTYHAVSTLDEWKQVSLSKVNLLVELLQHHLLDDDHKQVDWVDVDGLSTPI